MWNMFSADSPLNLINSFLLLLNSCIFLIAWIYLAVEAFKKAILGSELEAYVEVDQS